jgi:purine-binding chemotaxis protein CheW
VKELRLITFRVGTEIFVLDIMAVRQIISYSGATAIPTAPAFIEGIIVIRNEVIPIVDLRDRFKVEESQRSVFPLVVIVETAAGPIGLKTDEVLRMIDVTSDQLLAAPPVVRGVRGDLLVAIVPQGDDVYLLIDVESILTSEEQVELQSADLSSSATSAGTSDR